MFYFFITDAEDFEPVAPAAVAPKISDKWEGEDEEEPVKVIVCLFDVSYTALKNYNQYFCAVEDSSSTKNS